MTPQYFFDRIATPTRPMDLTPEEKQAIWEFMQPDPELGFSIEQRNYLQRVWLVIPTIEEVETIAILTQNQPLRFSPIQLVDETYVVCADLLLDVANYGYAMAWLETLYYRAVQPAEFVQITI
jgi:hypothetical protein